MPIFVDNRGEGEEELYHLLKSKHLAVEYQHVDSGDIVFGEVGIERKTISDLVGSVVGPNRRLWDQIEVLKNTYKLPFILIEGGIDWEDRLISGIASSILLGWKVPILQSYNLQESRDIITALFTKYGSTKVSGYPPAAVIKEVAPARVQWAMLQCVRGIGPATATKILKLVDICQLARMDPKRLAKQVKGLGPKTADKLVKVFQYGTH